MIVIALQKGEHPLGVWREADEKFNYELPEGQSDFPKWIEPLEPVEAVEDIGVNEEAAQEAEENMRKVNEAAAAKEAADKEAEEEAALQAEIDAEEAAKANAEQAPSDKELSPQQRAANTRKANEAAKEAAAKS